MADCYIKNDTLYRICSKGELITGEWPIISKDEFIKCYEEWIVNNKNIHLDKPRGFNCKSISDPEEKKEYEKC